MRKCLFVLLALLISAGSFNITNAAFIVPVATTEPSPAAVKAATDAFKSLSKK